MLIDTHCHLDDERLIGGAADIIQKFADDGLYAVVSSSSDYKSSTVNFDLAERYAAVYATVGVHPQEAKDRKQSDYDEFIKMSKSEKVVAVGEIGLDYYYEYSPREVQKTVLAEQLELADALKLPVVFHVRDAYEDFLNQIKQNKKYLNNGGVLHCYSGSAEYMRELADFDFYFGFDGPLTYKNARHSVEALRAADINRILFETDSPYLAPVPLRGQTNVPANVSYVAECAAKLLEMPFDEICQIEINNTKALYKKIK